MSETREHFNKNEVIIWKVSRGLGLYIFSNFYFWKMDLLITNKKIPVNCCIMIINISFNIISGDSIL